MDEVKNDVQNPVVPQDGEQKEEQKKKEVVGQVPATEAEVPVVGTPVPSEEQK